MEVAAHLNWVLAWLFSRAGLDSSRCSWGWACAMARANASHPPVWLGRSAAALLPALDTQGVGAKPAGPAAPPALGSADTLCVLVVSCGSEPPAFTGAACITSRLLPGTRTLSQTAGNVYVASVLD